MRPTASFRSVCSKSSITPAAASATLEPERVGDLALDLRLGALGVELDVAAEEVVRVDPAEDDVQVGDRDRLQAALRPAHADPRPGRVGAELGPVRVRVDAHERAGAGAERVDPDERHVEHEAGDVGRRRDVEAPVGDQRDVERGARRCRCRGRSAAPGARRAPGRRRRRRSAPRRASSPAPSPRSRSCRRARPSPAARTPAPASFVWSRTFCIVPREGSAA